MPGWVQDAVWWHVYPLGFVGAEREGTDVVTSRLGRLTAWLDYMVELGPTAWRWGRCSPRARTVTTPSTTPASTRG